MNPAISKTTVYVLVILAAVALPYAIFGFLRETSGEFDLSTHSVPLDQILSGGPAKDAIPAILHPDFIAANEAGFLSDGDRILGLAEGQIKKAYPVKILNWHEIVNDSFGGERVVVTYCPLCGTGIGFEATINDQVYTFGVSGLLYQSDLLMYDHQTESLWSQIAMEAIAGPLTGNKLHHVFLGHTTWGEWRRTHPDTLVLSTQTGYHRDYSRDPYLGYAQRADLMFPTEHTDDRYHPKEWVLGLEVNGVFKAYPFQELKRFPVPVRDLVNEKAVHVYFNPASQSASVTDTKGSPFPSIMAYWFAWYAFHPETLVFKGH